jgi:uncharacterized protein YjcR
MPAPPGNTNALKHGFYSRQFREREIKDLDLLVEASQQANLIDEIAMLRVTMRRCLEMAQGIQDIETAIKWLGVLGATATRISSLLKTQKILGIDAKNVELDAISLALDMVAQDWGLKDQDP